MGKKCIDLKSDQQQHSARKRLSTAELDWHCSPKYFFLNCIISVTREIHAVLMCLLVKLRKSRRFKVLCCLRKQFSNSHVSGYNRCLISAISLCVPLLTKKKKIHWWSTCTNGRLSCAVVSALTFHEEDQWFDPCLSLPPPPTKLT